jgi:hypothetical protein
MIHLALMVLALSLDSLFVGVLTGLVDIQGRKILLALLFAICDGTATWTGLAGFGTQGVQLTAGYAMALLALLCLVFLVLAARRGIRDTLQSCRGSIYLLPVLLSIDNLTLGPSLVPAGGTQVLCSLLAAAASGILYCAGSLGGELARRQVRRLWAACYFGRSRSMGSAALE